MDFVNLVAFSIPILIGYLILLLLLPNYSDGRVRIGYLWKLFLAPGIGFALVSCIYFLWSVIFTPDRAIIGLLFIESIIVVILTLTYYFSWKRMKGNDPNSKQKKLPTINLLTIIATLVFIIVILNFLEAWQRESFQTPFGDWDAWAIWNLRAGFIASGGEWLKGFSQAIAWSHPDYPLLLPLNVARMWVILGDRSVLVPILLGLVFQLSLVGLLATSVRIFRGNLQGIIAGIVGLVVVFMSLSFKLYADIPIAYYFLAANALIFFGDMRSTNKQKYLILAGFLTGASLWTKNEGWAFLISITLSKLLLDLVSRNKLSQSAKWWGYLLIGLLPVLLVTVYFKIAYAPPGDILTSLDLTTIKAKVLSVSRYLTILRFARNQFMNYGNLIVPVLPLLIIYGIIVGISFPTMLTRGILFLTLRIMFLGIIYFFIYLLTPKDLNWHLSTSIERLVTQIMPSFLFLYFLVISTVNGKKGESKSTFSLDWYRLGSKSG